MSGRHDPGTRQLFYRLLHNARALGTAIHAIAGLVFGMIYFLIFAAMNALVFLCALSRHRLRLLSRSDRELWSHVHASERHPIETYKKATLEEGLLHGRARDLRRGHRPDRRPDLLGCFTAIWQRTGQIDFTPFSTHPFQLALVVTAVTPRSDLATTAFLAVLFELTQSRRDARISLG